MRSHRGAIHRAPTCYKSRRLLSGPIQNPAFKAGLCIGEAHTAMAPIFNITAILFALITCALYWYGLRESYLFLYQWYDIPLHVFAGVAIGAWGSALAARREFSVRSAVLLVLALALCVGVAWEVYEYMAGLARVHGYWQDTIKDMADDLLGALLMALVYWRRYPHKIISKDETSNV